MSLCATCHSVDILNLLRICLLQCRDKQKALSHGETYDNRPHDYEGSEVKHHSDIFEVEKSSKDCDLCKIIFQAFKRTNVQDVEVARGLQIMFRAIGNKIEVCYNVDAKERLIKLCGLDTYMDGPNVEVLFQECQIKEDTSPPILRRMEPSSKDSTAIASRWLKDCVESHPSCRPPTKFQKPPRRLIHVGNENQNLFLVETFPDLQHVEWLSLSYCWGVGVEPLIKLTSDTMSALKNGLPLIAFDKAIQDAVFVTRALEISYIWIDALCIRQGEDDPEFSEEASKMNEIYGGSTVTLVIASSDSVKNEFLKERNLNYIPVAYSTKAEDHEAKVFLYPEWDDSEREYNGPWSKRGWTMQEGLLPNRLLHYTSSQMIWKCCEEERFERGVTERVEDKISKILTYSDYDDLGFGSGFLWQLPAFLKYKGFESYLPANLDYPLMSQSDTFRLWYDLVEDYTPRKLKNPCDRLVAISGLAKIYSDMIRNPTYVAGLWKEDLIRGLLWHVEGSTLIPKGSGDNIPTSSKAFPSWSWISVGYEIVKNDLKTDDGLCALSQIENIQIDLVDLRNPFGAVKSGSVTISGPFLRLPRLYNKEWASAEASMSELERHISEIVEEESQDGIAHKYSFPPGGHFSVLVMLGDIGSLYLLVLEATGEILNGINIYRRVGIVKLLYVDPSSCASPKLIATLNKMETSITARLGLRKEAYKTRKILNSVFIEVNEGNWVKETVIIV